MWYVTSPSLAPYLTFSKGLTFSIKKKYFCGRPGELLFRHRCAGNKPIISFSLTHWLTNKFHVYPLPLAGSKYATFQAHLRCSRKLSAPVRKKGNSRSSVMPAGKSMAISGRLRSNFSRLFTRWSWLMRQCYWRHTLKCRCLCVWGFPSQLETCLDKLTDGLWMIDCTSGFKKGYNRISVRGKRGFTVRFLPNHVS